MKPLTGYSQILPTQRVMRRICTEPGGTTRNRGKFWLKLRDYSALLGAALAYFTSLCPLFGDHFDSWALLGLPLGPGTRFGHGRYLRKRVRKEDLTIPYIKPEERPQFDRLLHTLARRIADNPGHLNYCVTRLVNEMWQTRASYQTIALVTGVLDNVKTEFYRRVAVDYEEYRRDENGDVFGVFPAPEKGAE